MKVLIDTNILMDCALCRVPHYKKSAEFMFYCIDNDIERAIAAQSILNMHYILRKTMSDSDRRATLTDIITANNVIPVDFVKLYNALSRTDFKDYEDCVQEECAVSFGADFIVTRNVKDFEKSRIPAVTPEQFLSMFNGGDKA